MGKTLLSNNVDAEVCFTNSECFPDGSALEQISISGKSDSPTLLLQTKKTNRIAPEIVYRGRTYRPALPSSEIGKSILLPDGVKGYDSAGRLFNQLSKVFIKFCALPELQAALLASWVISTWFADQMFNPPTLWIIGADVIRVMHLFEILRRLCRRPLTLTGLTSARLSSLPMALHPTLLVSAPGSSVLKTLLESNFRDLLVPGPEGVAQDLRCAKAVYTGTKDLPQPWMHQVIQLPLSRSMMAPHGAQPNKISRSCSLSFNRASCNTGWITGKRRGIRVSSPPACALKLESWPMRSLLVFRPIKSWLGSCHHYWPRKTTMLSAPAAWTPPSWRSSGLGFTGKVTAHPKKPK